MADRSFAEFYAGEYAGAVRLAYFLLGSLHAAEDLAQDSFIAIEPRMSRLDNPLAYLRTIIVNGASSVHRKRLRRSHAVAPMFADRFVTPVEAELFDVLARLPYPQRAALTLRFWCDASLQETADLMGCRVGTVKSLVSRGLERLRTELKDVM
ncbi:MAG: SigE family polymerase sigma factor [Ilumatobacteraceae bacterium]|nr:SigE family polymerase sigma factor [Ilumatobacteraceae bacterium]